MGDKYQIGAVVKLTGLTSHNIRVWEKRHQAVVANRLASGRRYYTQEQINRLLLLKQCISRGFSIGELAELSDDQLQEKIAGSRLNEQQSTTDEVLTLGVLSQSDLTEQLRAIPGLDMVVAEHTTDFSKVHLHEQLLQKRPDIIVLEIPSITGDSLHSITELIKQTNPLLVVPIYRFCNQTHLTALRNQGARLLRAPIDHEALFYLLTGFLASRGSLDQSNISPPVSQYPAHLYTHAQLLKIANLPSKVECECPHHLADLLTGLKEFERYSGECINKNDQDAALHGKIQVTTASARQQLERLLEEVLKIEGINV